MAPILSIWVIGTALNGLMHVPYMAQLAHGWSRLTVIVNTIAAIIIIPAFLIFVPRYGVMAAAWIWVAINAGYILFAVPAMHLKILTREKWKWYGVDVFAPLLTGLVVALAMLFWTRQHPDLEVTIEFSLLTLGAILVLFTTTITTPLGRHAIFSALRHVNGVSR